MKPLKVSFIALGIACVFFAAAVIYQKADKKPQIVGGYAFAKTYGKLLSRNKIVLDDGQNKFSLLMEDGNWRIAERNMYFADHNMVNFLISAISRSRIKNFKSEENADFEFVPEWNITVYDGDKVLDEVSLKKNTDGKYLGKVNDDDTIYELSGYFDFPHEYKMWLPQPLVAVKVDDIYEVRYGDNYAKRGFESSKFVFSEEDDRYKLITILSELGYLEFFNARAVSEIKEKSDITNMSVELFSGLIYNLEFYMADDKYYAELRLDTAAASEMGTRNYVEQNKVLYEGWAFELDPEKYAIFSALK